MQTFDPHKHYGASSARFFNYINLCPANKFRSMHSRRAKNPLCRPGEHLRGRCQRQERQREARHALAEFSEFVDREDSSVLPAMEAIASTATPSGAANWLGTTRADFCLMRSRLRQLGRCFQSDDAVPRKRRPYKEPTSDSAEFPSRIRAAARLGTEPSGSRKSWVARPVSRKVTRIGFLNSWFKA